MKRKISRALISVTEKVGVVDFARTLAQLGVEIISTGGTARAIRDGGVTVTEVSDFTGFPEMLDGRVKTLHPKIAAGILAMRSNPGHMQALSMYAIKPIDLVVVNLYDFAAAAANPEATLEECIEQIDIGGPTMIRAAAKNYKDVAVVVDPEDYQTIIAAIEADDLDEDTLFELAKKAFALTAAYDRQISQTLEPVHLRNGKPIVEEGMATGLPPTLDLVVPMTRSLRYGENPHQHAALYAPPSGGGVAGGTVLSGKEMSFNNFVDADAAWQLVQEFRVPACVIVKHTNPCGCATHSNLLDAYNNAYEADPTSAFGGIVAFNNTVEADLAGKLAMVFYEVVVAPGYSKNALDILCVKKNLRILQVSEGADGPQIKTISGGYLVQRPDVSDLALEVHRGRVVTMRNPSSFQMDALEMAWITAKHCKSNAITYAEPGRLISAGVGQMSRVFAARIGAEKSVLALMGTAVGSDAFFPYPDGVQEVANHGVTAIVQPGGSVKDAEVIATADRLGLAMIFTGHRHFRH